MSGRARRFRDGDGLGDKPSKEYRCRESPEQLCIMKGGTSTGRIPAKVLLAERARVTAGFAKEVEAVNQ